MLAGICSQLRARWPSIRSQVHEQAISFGQPKSQCASFLILSNSGGAESAAKSGPLLQDTEKCISITRRPLPFAAVTRKPAMNRGKKDPIESKNNGES